MKVFSAEVDSGDDSTDLDNKSNDNEISDNTMPSTVLQTLDLEKSETKGQRKVFFLLKQCMFPTLFK